MRQEATEKSCLNSNVATEPTAVQEFGMFDGMEHDNKGIVNKIYYISSVDYLFMIYCGNVIAFICWSKVQIRSFMLAS